MAHVWCANRSDASGNMSGLEFSDPEIEPVNLKVRTYEFDVTKGVI